MGDALGLEAVNEAERLLNAEKVDMLLGIYSSAIAVPLAEKATVKLPAVLVPRDTVNRGVLVAGSRTLVATAAMVTKG